MNIICYEMFLHFLDVIDLLSLLSLTRSIYPTNSSTDLFPEALETVFLGSQERIEVVYEHEREKEFCLAAIR